MDPATCGPRWGGIFLTHSLAFWPFCRPASLFTKIAQSVSVHFSLHSETGGFMRVLLCGFICLVFFLLLWVWELLWGKAFGDSSDGAQLPFALANLHPPLWQNLGTSRNGALMNLLQHQPHMPGAATRCCSALAAGERPDPSYVQTEFLVGDASTCSPCSKKCSSVSSSDREDQNHLKSLSNWPTWSNINPAPTFSRMKKTDLEPLHPFLGLQKSPQIFAKPPPFLKTPPLLQTVLSTSPHTTTMAIALVSTCATVAARFTPQRPVPRSRRKKPFSPQLVPQEFFSLVEVKIFVF